eukprot:scaffold443_cov125-Cylindrotheca_fusiformis.AAC.35
MPDYFLRCQDGQRCEHGSMCTENPNEEGSFYCDCSTAVGGKFAGLYCEYEAQSDCKFSSDTEPSWFCVNNGDCKVKNGEWTCECTTNYEGPHCEFINGAVPNDWPGEKPITKGISASDNGDGLEGGIIAAIVISVLIFFGLLGYVIYKKRRGEDLYTRKESKGQNAPRDQSEALAIDADGGVLKESVRAMIGNGKVDDQGFPLPPTPEDEARDANGEVNGHLL